MLTISFLSLHTTPPHPILHRSFVSRSFVIPFLVFFFAKEKAKSSLKPNALQVFCQSVNPVKRREERERTLPERLMEREWGRGEILLDKGGSWGYQELH